MGKKKSTIKDVAGKAGVSISVVSYVLNDKAGISVRDETRKRIMKAAGELNYIPNARARSMKTKRSGNIAFAAFWDISDAVFSEVLKGIHGITSKNDYLIILSSMGVGKGEFAYVDLFESKEIDGVVIFCPYEGSGYSFNEKKHIELLEENGIPAVMINGFIDSDINRVSLDYYDTAYSATDKLIKTGHEKIGYLIPQNPDNRQASLRFSGYKDAISEAGITFDSSLIFTSQDHERLVETLESRRMSGIVLHKAGAAPELFRHLHKSGVRIPEDISITAASWDNYTDHLNPALACSKIRLAEAGAKAAEQLLADIKGNTAIRKTLIKSDFIDGNSIK